MSSPRCYLFQRNGGIVLFCFGDLLILLILDSLRGQWHTCVIVPQAAFRPSLRLRTHSNLRSDFGADIKRLYILRVCLAFVFPFSFCSDRQGLTAFPRSKPSMRLSPHSAFPL